MTRYSRRSPVRMMMVPGDSLPSNGTVSRGIGAAIGCNCESRALARTGPAPALRKRPAIKAARIRLRRMISLVKTTANLNEHAAVERVLGPIRGWRDYGARWPRGNVLWRSEDHEPVNCVRSWRRRHIGLSSRVRQLDPAPDEDFNDRGSNPNSNRIGTRMECSDEDGSDPD